MSHFESLLNKFPEIHPVKESSNWRRFIDAFNTEVEQAGLDIEQIEESHYIDTATGDELDEIGAMFGVVGRRDGRTDAEYRSFLKSVVRSFKSRGTKPQIIEAIEAALDIEETDDAEVTISEDLQNLSYRVELTNWPVHNSQTIVSVADRADPSGITFDRVIYTSEGDYAITSSSDSTALISTGLGTFTLGNQTLGA